jgi:hypothetical protein
MSAAERWPAPTERDAMLADAARRLREQGFRCSPLPPYWLPAATAAAILLRTESRLKQWRAEGKGPTSYKLDKSVQYRLADVLEFRLTAKADW